MEPKLFLGGVTGNNNWREEFVKRLVALGYIPEDFFNPVARKWSLEFKKEIVEAKSKALYVLYYIANPYDGNGICARALVEATTALYDQPDRTIVFFDFTGLTANMRWEMVHIRSDLEQRFLGKRMIFSNIETLFDFLTTRLF